MPTILSADVPIHVETDGDDRRPALLLINPLGTTLEVWDPIVEHLAAYNFVIRFDIRGHGGSDGDVAPYEIADLGRDAIAVLDALEVTRAHVFGASMGGLVALWLAASHPERVERLILASTAPRLGADYRWQRIVDLVEREGLEAAADELEEAYFSATCRSQAPSICADAREMLLATPVDAYLAGARAILDADLLHAARPIRASTLLIVGADDPILRHHPALDLLNAISDAEAVEVGGAAHRVILEQPDAIAGVVHDFLTDPDGR